MKQYNDLLKKILSEGELSDNRTGVRTLTLFGGASLQFDMKDGFPAPTNKKLAFKTMLGELLGFFRSYDNAADFRNLSCKVWDGNANLTPAWVNNPNRKGTDDLGKIYGAIWNDYEDMRVVLESDSVQYLAKGYSVMSRGTSPEGQEVVTVRKGINQIEEAFLDILTNPTSRRIIITGWRPDFFDRMALPPCHVDYCFNVDTVNKTLHLTLWQRSFDAALAFNIQIGATWLELFAQMAGLKAGKFTHFISCPHIYENHIEGVNTMLSREDYKLPQLKISDKIANYEQFKLIVEDSSLSISEKREKLANKVKGIFTKLEPEHFELINYKHHPPVVLPFAA